MKASKPYRVFLKARSRPATISFDTEEAMLAYLRKLECDEIKALYVDGQKQNALTIKALWLSAWHEERPNGKPIQRRKA